LEVGEVVADVVFGTDGRVAQHIEYLLSLWGCNDLFYLLVGEVTSTADHGAHAVETHLFKKLISFVLGFSGADVDAGDDRRGLYDLRGLEILAVVACRLL